MDVTRYKTSDQKTMFIYTVLDNFSRKILAWDVSDQLSGKIRLQSLKRAVKEQFLDKKLITQNLDLIVDGGSENNNINIHEFIKSCKIGIHKQIALKDVKFSNSIIEGSNRILKQTYLKDKILTADEFLEYIGKSIKEFNSERPHYFHKIYTPDEVYENPDLKNFTSFFDKLNKHRIENNLKYSCGSSCI